MNINFGAFIENLSYMGKGMLGIFVSIGMIILVIALLNLMSGRKK